MRIEAGITVFVTGGGGGIGLATAQACAAKGAKIVLADIVQERLDTTVAAFDGGPALGVQMDISRPEDWTRAREEAEARFGTVDILINSAAIPPSKKPLLETTPQEFQERISANLFGTFLGLRTFGPAMRERRRGHIVNVASECGIVAMAGLGDYTAAKYGVVGMTEVLRTELAGDHVGVSVVLPGLTRSNMTVGMGMDPAFVGQAILSGIEADSPYVFTHPQIRSSIEHRFEAILASIGQSADPDYAETVKSSFQYDAV